jgi:hypothetical protein
MTATAPLVKTRRHVVDASIGIAAAGLNGLKKKPFASKLRIASHLNAPFVQMLAGSSLPADDGTAAIASAQTKAPNAAPVGS